MGDTTDGVPWKQRAVTFVENHDTGYRTNEDGSPQQGHSFDSFQNNWEVEQAYAYILTHPGRAVRLLEALFRLGRASSSSRSGPSSTPGRWPA